MKRTNTSLNDAFVVETKKYEDERGFFIESFNEKNFNDIGLNEKFVQDNHSRSSINVLRGLHYQVVKPQGKLVRCMTGRVMDVIVDLRKSSSTFGKHFSIELSSPEVMLWVPPGFAHGFYCLTEVCDISYKTTDYYYKEYDRTLFWNDLDIKWPSQSPILSEKDKNGKQFSECEKYD